MRLNFGANLKEYRSRCAQAGLNIVYEQDLEVPYAGVNKSGQTLITVPMPDPMWEEPKWVQWEYMMEHELGHLMPKCIDSYELLKEKKLTPKSFLGAMLNVAEDNRQEWCDYYELEGRRQRLNKGRRQFLDSVPDSHLGKSGGDKHRDAFEAFYTWDTLSRASWMPALNGKAESQLPLLTEEQCGWVEKLVTGGYDAQRMVEGLSASELYDWLLRVIEEVFELDSDQEEQDAQSQAEGEGDEESDGDSKGDGKGKEADGDGEGGKGAKGKRGEGDGDTEGAVGGTVKYSDLLAHAHDTDVQNKFSGTGLKIEYDGNTGVFRTSDPEDYQITDYQDTPPDDIDDYYRDQAQRTVGRGNGLAKHVRRLLQVRSQSTYQHGMKRGKISPKSIYRGGLRGTPSEKKVFKKKIDSDVLNTVVYVLVDFSGSMDGEKAVNAGVSAALLNSAISTIGVPLEITAFDSRSTKIRHKIWKRFASKVSTDVILDRAADSANTLMSCNSDGESIMWSYNRLTGRREKRKILIVLSDGSPAVGGKGDADWHTNKVIKEIERAGVVELYGIGIEDDNVKRLYKDCAVIRDSSELESALLNVIEKKILS